VISVGFAMQSRDAESIAVRRSNEAQEERDRANELLSQSLRRSLETTFAAVPRIHGLPGGAEAAERVLRRTIEDLEALDKQSGGAPKTQIALAEAHAKLGDILGNPQFANLGDPDGSKQAYARVIAILDALPDDPKLTRRSDFLRARMLRKRVELRGRNPDAVDVIADLDRVRALLAPLVEADPDEVTVRAELAVTLKNQSWELMRRDRLDVAAERAEAAVREFEVVCRLKPEETRYTQFLGSALVQLARVHARLDQGEQAAAAYERAITLVEPLADTPRKVMTTGLYMYWIERSALALKQKDFARAERLIVKAKDHAVSQCEADPKNHRRRFGLCVALIEWVRVAEQTHGALADGKPPQEARDRALEAAEIIERVAGGKEARIAVMFGGQLRDYAAGKQEAGSLMGVTGR
jgi:tetratricopeptide (TPR) repeat protein